MTNCVLSRQNVAMHVITFDILVEAIFALPRKIIKTMQKVLLGHKNDDNVFPLEISLSYVCFSNDKCYFILIVQ